MKRLPRSRQVPRISANKLGEFLTTASPTRRRAIIRGQKTPTDVIVARYTKAVGPIGAFLRTGGTDASVIADAIQQLRSATPRTTWTADDNQNTANALEQFIRIAPLLPFDDVRYFKRSDPGPLVISGTEVSVRPDFVLRADRRGKKCIGALKIHFIKDDANALPRTGQEYVATLCHQWLVRHTPDSFTPTHSLCLSLDLFRGQLVPAPKAATRRITDIEAACSEIALAWPVV